IQDVMTNSLFVSHQGDDLNNCGNWTMPCRTVRHAVKMSNDGDQIYIDYAQGRPYMECENLTQTTCSIELTKSVSFHGSSSFKITRIKFLNLVISNSNIVAELDVMAKVELIFQNMLIRDNSCSMYSKNSIDCSIKIFNSSFVNNFNFRGIYLRCVNLTVHINTASFILTPVLFTNIANKPTSWKKTEILVQNTIFDGKKIKKCAPMLMIKPFAATFNVTISDSEFKNQFANCSYRRDSRLSTLLISDYNSDVRNITLIYFSNLKFENNYNNGATLFLSAAYLEYTAVHVMVKDSIFRNNSIALRVGSRYLGGHHSPAKQPTIILENNTFVENFYDKVKITGAAAIHFTNVKTRVSSCRFLDNKPGQNPYTGVVKIAEWATVTFFNSYFENRQMAEQTNQLFASGNKPVYFRGKNTFNLVALKESQTVFIRVPSIFNSKVIIKKNFKILCPQGYKVNSQRECVNIKNAYLCFYINIQCEQCPTKTYTIERGKFIFNKSNDIQCLQCPRGGDCGSGLVTPKPNFWGYRTNMQIVFVQCPPGYCCDSEDCVTYDGCHGNRSGTLCGQCPEEMSESLFSTQCISNTECSFNYFFIIGTIAMLVLYLVFFLYHKEIVSILRTSLFSKRLSFSIDNRNERRNNVSTGGNTSSPSGMIKIFFYYYQLVAAKFYFLMFDRIDENDNTIALICLPVLNAYNKLVKTIFYERAQRLTCMEQGRFSEILPSAMEIMFSNFIYASSLLLILLFFQGYRMNLNVVRDKSAAVPVKMGAFANISLLMYAASTQLCLSLLHCVPVRDNQVLFLDGNVKCYQTFQYFLLAYMISSILPFCLVPVLGSYLLKSGRIDVKQFCAACIFPLPFCCFWMNETTSTRSESACVELVLIILCVSILIRKLKQSDNIKISLHVESVEIFVGKFFSLPAYNIFVSHRGQDEDNCGNWTLPCRSVRYAVNISSANDVIHIDYANGRYYKECEDQSHDYIELNKTLSFHGMNGTPIIQCQCIDCNFFRINNGNNSFVKITFQDLILSTTGALVTSYSSFGLVFTGCTLRNYDIGVYVASNESCSIKIFNSLFQGKAKSALLLNCLNLTTHLVATTFQSSPIELSTSKNIQRRVQTIEVFISKCTFDGQHKHTMTEQLLILLYATTSNITLQNSTFRNYYGRSDWEGNAVSSILIMDIDYGVRKTTLSFDRLLFENIHCTDMVVVLKPLQIANMKLQVSIVNSMFRNTTPALAVVPNPRHFVNKAAIKIYNNTFLGVHETFSNTWRTLVYLGFGRFHVASCRFLNNTAENNPYDALIHITSKANVQMEDCYFESDTLSIQIYAEENSQVSFERSNIIDIKASKRQEGTILLYTPSVQLIITGSLRILCPQGYNMISQLSCDLRDSVIYCSYLTASCEQCPQRTYSLERGELLNNTKNNLKCQDCPKGGNCLKGRVTAKPNFWGYRSNRTVKFLQCPPKYCCDTDHCKDYNSCHGNRMGTLCGECPSGMSESLFDTKCKPNKECSSVSFWPGIICYLMVYLVFFLYHEEVFTFVQHRLSFRLSTRHHPSKPSGLLKILFYYYQVLHLLRTSVGSRANGKFVDEFENVIARFLNLLVIDIPFFDCPFKNVRPVQKAVILHSVGYGLLTLLAVLYLFRLLYVIGKQLTSGSSANMTVFTDIESSNQERNTTSFVGRVASAFAYISLPMYASSAQLCLSLLHCVPVGDSQVLFLDGNVKCYQTFQYFLLAYMITSILPFCLVPVLGSYLLKMHRISVPQFCLACMFPLPFCCYWTYLLIRNNTDGGRVLSVQINDLSTDCDGMTESTDAVQISTRTETSQGYNSPARTSILRVLIGPFRPHKSRLIFPASNLPWEGFLIFRRLALILVLMFIYDNRLKMFIALTLSIVILMTHMYVKPFINQRDNLLEALSLGALIILSGFSLIKAMYYGEDLSYSSSNLSLLKQFNLIENIFIVTPLVVILVIVSLSLLLKLIICLRAYVNGLLRSIRTRSMR
ncbi:Hypothetical predicted protein, partial [Paramuricea clavata]